MGGLHNEASGNGAVVSGGTNNIADEKYCTVAGGYWNIAAGYATSINGGYRNKTEWNYSNVCGGYYNEALASASVVSGGEYNIIYGEYSAIPGGANDTLGGLANYAMAFGRNVYINSGYTVAMFSPLYPGYFGLNRDDNSGGISHPIHVGTDATNGNGAHLTSGGTWTNGSSREFKDNFASLDGNKILTKISNMPIMSWKYKDTNEKHVGPVAEDFVKAFDVGTISESNGQRDNQYLSASDVAGVALVGVQALLNKIEQLEKRIVELEGR